jgi:hypothetical protein
MAAKKKRNNLSQKIDFNDWIWCIDNLSKSQLELFDSEVDKWVGDISYFNAMIEDGFQITVKHDNYNNCKQASGICQFKGYDNSGLAISARSDDAEDALGILFFKYFKLADRDLRGFSEKVPKGVRG